MIEVQELNDLMLGYNACEDGSDYLIDCGSVQAAWDASDKPEWLMFVAVLLAYDYKATIAEIARDFADMSKPIPCIKAIEAGKTPNPSLSYGINIPDYVAGMAVTAETLQLRIWAASELVENKNSSYCDIIRNNITLN